MENSDEFTKHKHSTKYHCITRDKTSLTLANTMRAFKVCLKSYSNVDDPALVSIVVKDPGSFSSLLVPSMMAYSPSPSEANMAATAWRTNAFLTRQQYQNEKQRIAGKRSFTPIPLSSQSRSSPKISHYVLLTEIKFYDHT